tara:strand:+ start:6538 stop:7197 length:660 start_codon:yes stop_codon:yes gene_type:complete
MLLNNSKPYYQFIDNQSNHTWIVVSGWSLLGSFVIKPVKKSNVLFVSDYDPYTLLEDIDFWFKEYAIQDYSIMGFSLGGLWLSRYVSYFMMAKRVVFSGIRSRYMEQDISSLRLGLESNFCEILTLFWRNCISVSYNSDTYFQNQQDYSWQCKRLLRGLDYLNEFDFQWPLEDEKVHFFHGQLDRIAPLKEITKQDAYDFQVIKRQGHICCPDLDILDG